MCAGSIHTPQILQLSGLGPARQLQERDIPVVADLPAVGQNMQVRWPPSRGVFTETPWEGQSLRAPSGQCMITRHGLGPGVFLHIVC